MVVNPSGFRYLSSAVRILSLSLVFGEFGVAQSERGDYVKQRQMAVEQYREGHFGEAETLFLNALHGAEANKDDYSVALDLSGLGDIYQMEGRFREAEAAYRKSVSILRRTQDSNLAVAIALHNLAASYTAAHRYRDALATLKEASQLAEKVQQPHEELAGQLLNSLGVLYFYKGKTGKAESLFQRAIHIYSAGGAIWAADLGQCLNNLAGLYRRKGQFQKSEDLYRRSIALTEERLGPSHPALTVTLESLGDLYKSLKRYTEAEAQYRRSLAIIEKGDPLLPVRLIHTLYALSQIYVEHGDKMQAEQVLARAADVAGPGSVWNPEIPDVLESYSRALGSVGKLQQAQELHRKAAHARAFMTLTVRAQDLR
jgi:tetratricopeptide (TPR) repeat protein